MRSSMFDLTERARLKTCRNVTSGLFSGKASRRGIWFVSCSVAAHDCWLERGKTKICKLSWHRSFSWSQGIPASLQLLSPSPTWTTSKGWEGHTLIKDASKEAPSTGSIQRYYKTRREKGQGPRGKKFSSETNCHQEAENYDQLNICELTKLSGTVKKLKAEELKAQEKI